LWQPPQRTIVHVLEAVLGSDWTGERVEMLSASEIGGRPRPVMGPDRHRFQSCILAVGGVVIDYRRPVGTDAFIP
jgi:hypothetical protein